MPDEGGIRGLFAVSTMHGVVTPRAVVVGRGERAVRVQQRNDVALRVENVVVERRGRAVVIDHGERLAAIVIDKLERLAAPSLPHDLAGERGVIVRRAVDRFAGTDAGHVVGVLHGLAIHDGLCKLAALRPREGIVLAVVVRDRIAGGRDVARLRLALIQDILGRAVRRHAREQVRPRGVGVAEGLCDRAVFRDAADVARRVVGIEEGRLAAVLLRHQLALRVVAILLRLGRLGHARARGHDLGDVAGLVIGIREAAALFHRLVQGERVARARQTRTHPVAAVILRDAVVGIGTVIDLGLLPVLVGHRDALGRQLAQVIVAIRGRDHALARNRGRDGADRAIDLFAVTILAGVGIALPERVAAELPRLRCEPVCVVVHVLRELHECAAARRLARMDEPAEAVVLVAVLLRDCAAAVRDVLPRKVVVAAVVVVVRSNVFPLMRRSVDIIICGGALPVKRVIGVADTVAVAVGHRGQPAVIDVALICIRREGDGRGIPLSLRA